MSDAPTWANVDAVAAAHAALQKAWEERDAALAVLRDLVAACDAERNLRGDGPHPVVERARALLDERGK